MIYISKGILKSSLRKPLKVTHCGKTVQLSGLQTEDNRRWININVKGFNYMVRRFIPWHY